MVLNDSNIMVVDDNEVILEMIATLLQAEGFNNIITFNNPLDALSAVSSGDESPKIVISDYNMPYFTGVEFLSIMELFVRDVASVIITADPYIVEFPPMKEYIILDKNINLYTELRKFVNHAHTKHNRYYEPTHS